MKPDDFPRFMVAAARKVSTIRSPTDGQEGLAVFWTRAAAEEVAHTKPGTVVVEATKEMLGEAMYKEMGVPWLYIGSDLDDGVRIDRVRLALVLGQCAEDGQHRHGEK